MPAPVARTNAGSAPVTRRGQSAGASVPFPIASLKRVRQAFQTAGLAPGQNVSSIEIPAAGGFLRYLELQVSGATSGNAAAVAYMADGPFSCLQQIEFLPPSGDPPIVPITGYQLYLFNRYGAFGNVSPNNDPRSDPNFVASTGTGAYGGSFFFTLRIPFEIDPESGFGSITNSAANKSYMLNFNVAPTATIYSTAPTTAPVITVTGYMYYWDEPSSNTRQGTTQATAPLGLGSFSQIRADFPVVTPGDKIIKVNNAGPVLRLMLLVLRNASSVRDAADLPGLWDFMFNTRDRFYVSDSQLVSDIAEAYGYGLNTGQGIPALDSARGLDTGVRTFPYFLDFAGVSPVGPRSQYQVTADATLTQIRGTSFGSGASTLEILTNLIRPTSAAALYPPNRI